MSFISTAESYSDKACLRMIMLLVFSFILFPGNSAHAQNVKWVGTWSTAPQLVEPNNNPPQPGLSNNTIRQVVHVSLGGDSLRLRFTNEFSTSSVTMKEVHIAVSKGGSVIDTTTDKTITFNGSGEVTIRGGAAVMSDPFHFNLLPLSDVTITIYFGSTSSDVTGHPGSRTTSYILTGNQASKESFTGSVNTDHWYIINTIEVLSPENAAAVAILGNSITDGRGSGTNKQNRWPDELARRLQANPLTQHVAVLNEGIGGNAVLRGGLGPTALNRFRRDVLNQNGVKWFIIFEGVNDIGGAGGASGSDKVAQDLISAYSLMIDSARVRGILVYGATILPFNGNGYYSVDHERARQTVNSWIRSSGRFDAVIDLDKAMRSPNDSTRLLASGDTGDHLHPNETGHRMMAEAVDLSLFVDSNTGINDSQSMQPEGFSLLQNYPNPFNPVTTIEFILHEKVFVTLKIYDALGREIDMPLSGEMMPGKYSERWNAAGFTSGVYFCQLQAGSLIQTKKLMLLK